MSKFITRIEENKTLLWTGYENFDPIEVQKKLKASGMSLELIREDKWAILSNSLTPEYKKETENA